jgi:hypothetical protein
LVPYPDPILLIFLAIVNKNSFFFLITTLVIKSSHKGKYMLLVTKGKKYMYVRLLIFNLLTKYGILKNRPGPEPGPDP